MKGVGFKVAVKCLTYNHAPYIEDAMNGFCIQQTSFPFVCCILDDASTDGEQEVIKRYLEKNFDLEDKEVVRTEETDDYHLIFSRHKTNCNCYFAVLLLKYNHYRKKSKDPYLQEWLDSEYIAFCEGDDYWTAPFKLQRQVEFMDDHPRHSLCFCGFERLSSDGTFRTVLRYNAPVECCSMKDIILGGGGFMATASIFYRKALYSPYSEWAEDAHIGDLPTVLTLAEKGPVGFLVDIMCVYRENSIGSWSSLNALDINRRRKHYESMDRIWRQYDSWTDRAYHKYVCKMLVRNRIEHLKDELLTLKRRFTAGIGKGQRI